MKNLILLFAFLLTQTNIISQDKNSSTEKYDVFSFEKEVTLPGKPNDIWEIVTGDISGWWDHSFSGKPYSFYIEPYPGGGFYEIFDEEGNGVLHATVIYADKGKLLRFDGPLGLSGKAIHIVTTYQLEAKGEDSTKFIVSLNAAGQVEEGIPAIVEKVWDHFIYERLEPYVNSSYKKD